MKKPKHKHCIFPGCRVRPKDRSRCARHRTPTGRMIGIRRADLLNN